MVRLHSGDKGGHVMLISYARVSTDDQHLDLHCDALTQAGCPKLYEDKEGVVPRPIVLVY